MIWNIPHEQVQHSPLSQSSSQPHYHQTLTRARVSIKHLLTTNQPSKRKRLLNVLQCSVLVLTPVPIFTGWWITDFQPYLIWSDRSWILASNQCNHSHNLRSGIQTNKHFLTQFRGSQRRKKPWRNCYFNCPVELSKFLSSQQHPRDHYIPMIMTILIATNISSIISSTD